jgi:hypothetical protein
MLLGFMIHPTCSPTPCEGVEGIRTAILENPRIGQEGRKEIRKAKRWQLVVYCCSQHLLFSGVKIVPVRLLKTIVILCSFWTTWSKKGFLVPEDFPNGACSKPWYIVNTEVRNKNVD